MKLPVLACAVLLTSAAAFAQPAAPVARTAPAAVPIPRTTFIANMDTDFKRIDSDHNGVVSTKEFTEYHRALAVIQVQARNRAIFNQLDADRSGQLSPAEFARLAAAPPTPNVAPMFAKLDTNRDSAISVVEYRAATLANFDRLDTDKDGVVSAAEMRAGGIIK